MLSIKQGGIKYHFLSLLYDATWDWIQVSGAIGEHSDHMLWFFQFPRKVEVIIFLFTFFQFYSVVSRYSKVHNFANSHFLLLLLLLLLFIIRSGLLAEIRWSVYMSKSHRSLCVSFSRTDAGLWIYYLFVLSNLNFWHIPQWITFPPSRV